MILRTLVQKYHVFTLTPRPSGVKLYLQFGELENCFLLSPSKSKLQRPRSQKEGVSHQGQQCNFLYNLLTLTCAAKVHNLNQKLNRPYSLPVMGTEFGKQAPLINSRACNLLRGSL
jgi:hypothetical protein